MDVIKGDFFLFAFHVFSAFSHSHLCWRYARVKKFLKLFYGTAAVKSENIFPAFKIFAIFSACEKREKFFCMSYVAKNFLG